jgi:hypothetical protein
MVFVIGRERVKVVAEIANRVWPVQDRFALHYPLLHGGFISRRNSAAKDRRLGPAPECLHIGRQEASLDEDVIIDPDDIAPFGNIYRSV